MRKDSRRALDKALPNAPTVQNFDSGDERGFDRYRRRGQSALTKNHQIVLDTLEKTFRAAEQRQAGPE